VENEDCSVNHLPSLSHQVVKSGSKLLVEHSIRLDTAVQFFIPLIFCQSSGFVSNDSWNWYWRFLQESWGISWAGSSQTYGRKRTLLFSGGLSILAAFVLALTQICRYLSLQI